MEKLDGEVGVTVKNDAEMKELERSLYALIDANFEAQLAETREVLHVRGVPDSGGERPSGVEGPLDDLLHRAQRMGFLTKNIDSDVGCVEMGEGALTGIWARLPGGDGSVVDEPGAADDRGTAVAFLYAMKALRDSGLPLRRRFRLILGPDGGGSRCISRYACTEAQPILSFSPDAELSVINAEQGILRVTISQSAPIEANGGTELIGLNGGDRFNEVPELAEAVIRCDAEEWEAIIAACRDLDVLLEGPSEVKITARGAAHATEPEKGGNAVQKLLWRLADLDFCRADGMLIDAVCRMAGQGHSGDGLGIESRDGVPLTCNLAAVRMEANETRKTKTVLMKLDIRYPVTFTPDDVIGNMKKAATEAGAELVVNTHKPPLYIPESHESVQTLLNACRATAERPLSVKGRARSMPDPANQAGENEAGLRDVTHTYAEALVRINESGPRSSDP
ncbi:MAG: hypothetical protein LBQ90_07920 [Synergistaceae bacterium]|jgi:succinyl-diaminopimelate desuccinylase|nr:hypothetical protein [Synergistaceae bacterium]